MQSTLIERMPRGAFEAMRNAFRAGGLGAACAALREVAPLPEPRNLKDHLEETVRWLFEAHDAAGQGGVARSYCLRQHRRYRVTGWLPAYPETTGYIIPTLYDVAQRLDWPEAAERAEKMARWEAEVQMESGAVRGGTIADEPSPAVFNTGQVLFGWLRAARETGDPAFQDSAARAARFLIEAQSEDGCWRKGASQFVSAEGHVYNARVAWALALYGKQAGDADACAAARRAAEFALARENGKGWYADNCLTDNVRPLVHTIAYTAQGILEIGLVLDEPRCVEATRRTADSLARLQAEQEFLAGRYDQNWKPCVPWSCLTGNAQMALVWDRLHALDGKADYREAADRAVHSVLSTQKLTTTDRGVRGGVAGSYPIWGGYGTYEYLNWAAKFLADALLSRVAGTPHGTDG